MKKALFGLLCVVLAGLLAAGLLQSRREEQERAVVLAELNQQLAPLYSRQRELQAERERMVETTNARLNGMSTLSLLVTDLNSDFFAPVVLSLQDAGIPAVMVLSTEQLPGEEGYIGAAEFQEYLADGWDYCLSWDGTEDFDTWYDAMAGRLETLELAMPQALYCEGGSYTTELAEAARARGITTIVHSGETGLPLIETEMGELWRPGCVSWISSGVKSRLQQTVEGYGSIAFWVGPDDGGIFDEEQFTSMLKTVNEYQGEGSLLAATLEEARQYRSDVEFQKVSYHNEVYEARLRELDEEIASLKERIQAIAEQR